MELADLKQKITKQCATYYRAKPLRKYSNNHLLSIIIEGGATLAGIKTEIVTAKSDIVALNAKFAVLSNTEVLDDFDTDTDANMQAFIDSKISGLTDEQKLDVALMIQYVKSREPVLEV